MCSIFMARVKMTTRYLRVHHVVGRYPWVLRIHQKNDDDVWNPKGQTQVSDAYRTNGLAHPLRLSIHNPQAFCQCSHMDRFSSH